MANPSSDQLDLLRADLELLRRMCCDLAARVAALEAAFLVRAGAASGTTRESGEADGRQCREVLREDSPAAGLPPPHAADGETPGRPVTRQPTRRGRP